MKIVFVNRVIGMFRGGGEIYDLSIARELSKTGHDVEFITGKPLIGECRYPVTEFKAHYCRSPYMRNLTTLIPVKGIGKVYLLDLMLFGIAAYRFIRKNAASIDFLYVQSDPVLAHRVQRNLKIRTVVRFPGPPDKLLIRFIEKNDLVVASGDSLPKLTEMTRKAIRDIPPGVDIDSFRKRENDLRSKYHIGNEPVVFLFVGRLVAVKNLLFLLDAFHEAFKINNNIRLLLVGAGSDYKALRSKVHAKQLHGKVVLAGHVDHAELPLYYSASDVLVLPSKYESFSIVTLEAMSCSLPVIASNRGYLPHLIEDGANGLLVDPEDPSSLVNALLELADNPERRLAMGQKNRAIVASKYTWCSRADQYENLFRITKSG